MKPTSKEFWTGLPASLVASLGLATVKDLEGSNAHEILEPMTRRYRNTPALVRDLSWTVGELREAYGARKRRAGLVLTNTEHRSAAVEDAIRAMQELRLVADDMQEDGLEEGDQLEALLHGVHADDGLADALAAFDAVVPAVLDWGEKLDDYGFPIEERRRLAALKATIEGELGDERDAVVGRHVATHEARVLLAKTVKLLIRYARWRAVIERRMDHHLPGFELTAGFHWHAMRPAERAARAAHEDLVSPDDLADVGEEAEDGLDVPAGPAIPGGIPSGGGAA